MAKFHDDETLLSNFDDDLASRILQLLELIESKKPSAVSTWLRFVRFCNKKNEDGKLNYFVNNFLTILEERYAKKK